MILITRLILIAPDAYSGSLLYFVQNGTRRCDMQMTWRPRLCFSTQKRRNWNTIKTNDTKRIKHQKAKMSYSAVSSRHIRVKRWVADQYHESSQEEKSAANTGSQGDKNVPVRKSARPASKPRTRWAK